MDLLKGVLPSVADPQFTGNTKTPELALARPDDFWVDWGWGDGLIMNSEHDEHHTTPQADETTPLLPNGVPNGAPHHRFDVYHIPMSIFWDEARILTTSTLTVYIALLFEFGLVVVSVVSIGHLSTVALAGVSLGSITAGVSGLSIITGFTTALETVLPSAWTSSTPQLVGLWTQRTTVLMIFVLIPIFAIWLNAEPILLLLRQDPEVAHLAALYLKYLSIGLPAYAFNKISRRYFQSQGLFTVPAYIAMMVTPINVLLNFLLVWGPPSIRLGFIGAPIAVAVSYNLIAVASVIYGIFFIPKTAWHPLSMRMFQKLGLLGRLGFAGVGQTAADWWSWELTALAASFLGPVALASQSILLISASTVWHAPYALSIAVSIRIGNLLGEENGKRAGVSALTSILMAVAISTAWSTLFLLFKDNWARIFNNDPEVVSLVATIIPLVAIIQVFDGVTVVTAGILRARGKQATGAVLNFTAYYVLGIPFGVWLAFNRLLGLYGLWLGNLVGLLYTSGAGTYLFLVTDWEKEVRKVQDRLAADQQRKQAVVDDA